MAVPAGLWTLESNPAGLRPADLGLLALLTAARGRVPPWAEHMKPEVRPHEALVSRVRLARIWGMGRDPLAAALRRLTAAGAVRVRSNCFGTFVIVLAGLPIKGPRP